jgi:hypothetical protein
MAAYHYEDLPRSSASEESSIMLSDFKHAELEDQEDTFAPSSKSILKRIGFPISLVSNFLFFVFILFLLAQPCYFSARNCVYEKRDKDAQAALPLMADVNKLVPECMYDPNMLFKLAGDRERIRGEY